MKVGKVIGSMETRRRADSLNQQRFVLVHAGGQDMAAVDQTGAKPGEQVLMVTGPAAAKFCMDAPVDAVVVAVIEQNVLGSEIPMRNAEKSYEQTVADAMKPF